MRFSRPSRPVSIRSRPHEQRQRGSRRTRTGLMLAISCIIALIAAFAPVQSSTASASARVKHGVRVKAFYLALGDSLTFGFQPNGDFNDGFAQQWFAKLRSEGSRRLINYGCPGATTLDFVELPGSTCMPTPHTPYTETQLDAGEDFIEVHRGKVSPVSLDIGPNDLVQAISAAITFSSYPPACTVNGAIARPVIRAAVKNIQHKILPELVRALTGPGGHRTGDLVIMNLYDPLQNVCPATVPYVEEFNEELAEAAAQFRVPVVDVFKAFGGEGVRSPYRYFNPRICTYTWYTVACQGQQQPTNDIHPTTLGYAVIARAFNRLVDDN